MLSKVEWHTVNAIKAIFAYVIGVLSFSLLEYILHRFLFHSEHILPNSKAVRYVHFLLHGIHHMLPVDP
jgi:4-hydroxysphinganine ceramide fatty acyl 2-hydroxylase